MKVLVAEDEPVSQRLLESSLTRWGYEVVLAKDGHEASQVLLSPDSPKIAILDWLMPGIEGIQLCQDLRRHKPEPYTYLILLTGKRAQQDVISGLEAGADDYICKPFNPAELKVRLRTGKRIIYLQDQLISAREALRDQATRDHLTGLWNRAAIMEILSDELDRSRRQNASFGVAIADLDHFKNINDTYGHLAGDDVLRKVALTMRDCTRRYDSIGRYGGEEFLVVLPGCNEINAISHAERMRAAVGRIILDKTPDMLSTSISAGVTIFDGTSNVHASDLIQAADSALYRAKRAGRGRVEYCDAAEMSTCEV